ncbi:MAG: TrkA family potassium uptake protein [Desulfobacterales bacterium]|nr:TrkA family potassium uptake protein [Desulfobacterales bacterium]
MKIVVIGLGSFGMNVARELYARGHDVLVVDETDDLVQKSQEFSSSSVVADCTEKEVLENLGLSTVETAIVSMGNNLSGSILATMYLKELGVKHIIVKAINDDHKKILEKVGATQVIFPEREMAVKLAQSITTPNVLDYLPLTNAFSIMEIIPPKDFVGKSLSDLDLRKKYQIQIIGIQDTVEDVISMVVSPSRLIKATDRLIILGKQEYLKKIKGLNGP